MQLTSVLSFFFFCPHTEHLLQTEKVVKIPTAQYKFTNFPRPHTEHLLQTEEVVKKTNQYVKERLPMQTSLAFSQEAEKLI